MQFAGEKVHWALLLEGDQGNGKSYFATVLRLVLGERNVKMVHNEQLHETFTDWQRNTQLVVVEESNGNPPRDDDADVIYKNRPKNPVADQKAM